MKHFIHAFFVFTLLSACSNVLRSQVYTIDFDSSVNRAYGGVHLTVLALNGDIAVLGSYSNTTVQPNYSTFYIERYDPGRNLLWHREFTIQPGLETIPFQMICNNQTGGYLIQWTEYDYNIWSWQSMLMEFDTTGALAWHRRYVTGCQYSEMGKMIQLTDGRLVIGSNDAACGSSLLYLDSAGNVLDNKTGLPVLTMVADTAGGLYALASGNNQELYLYHMDSAGTFTFIRGYQSALNWTGYVKDMHWCNDGTLIIGANYYYGSMQNTPYPSLMKVATNGSILWRKQWSDTVTTGYHVQLESFITTPDGHIFIRGRNGIQAPWYTLIHLDGDGTLLSSQWLANATQTYEHGIYAIAPGPQNGAILSCNESFSAMNYLPTFIVVDSTASFGCATWQYPMVTFNVPPEVHITIPVAFNQTSAICTVTNHTMPLSGPPQMEFIAECYEPAVSLGMDEREAVSLQVYPNPCSNELFVADAMPGAQYSILDIMGRTVTQATLQGSATSVDVSWLPAGLYILQLNDGEKQSSVRFVKE